MDKKTKFSLIVLVLTCSILVYVLPKEPFNILFITIIVIFSSEQRINLFGEFVLIPMIKKGNDLGITKYHVSTFLSLTGVVAFLIFISFGVLHILSKDPNTELYFLDMIKLLFCFCSAIFMLVWFGFMANSTNEENEIIIV